MQASVLVQRCRRRATWHVSAGVRGREGVARARQSPDAHAVSAAALSDGEGAWEDVAHPPGRKTESRRSVCRRIRMNRVGAYEDQREFGCRLTVASVASEAKSAARRVSSCECVQRIHVHAAPEGSMAQPEIGPALNRESLLPRLHSHA